MKKILILLLLPILIGAGILNDNLKYEVVSQVDYIQQGITHHNIRANVYNDNNTKSSQSIQVIKKDDTLETAVWSATNSEGIIRNKNVIDIAKDFEEKNDNYEVVAALNADYFSGHATINASMLHGSRLMDPFIHEKYNSIELNKEGQYINTFKSIKLGMFYAYFYDETTDALYDVVELLPLNSRVINDDETAIYYNYSSINNTPTDHFKFEILQKSIIGDHYMFYLENGQSSNTKIETSTISVSMISKNDRVNELLEKGVNIKIQKRTTEISESHTLVGVDSEIIKDGMIKTFDAIGGQSISNTTSRHPRTGIGFDVNNNPILFTVDGRNSNGSEGVNLREFAKIMQENGVYNGFNLDGGGSTQAVIKKQGVFEMVNAPSESNPYRTVTNALLFIKPKDASKVILVENDSEIVLTLPTLKHQVYLNGSKLSVSDLDVVITKNPLMNQVISVVNPTTLSSIYNTIFFQSQEPQPVLPEINVSHEIRGTKVDILVNFTDPDNLIDRMYVIHQITEDRKPALIQHMGLRKATFDQFLEGENNYIIYYELKNGIKDELSYSFNTVDLLEPEIPDTLNNMFIPITVIITSVLLATSLMVVLIKKRKK